MLAPRKKLWSTPKAVIDVAERLLSLKKDDVLYDIGCGDGRVLIQIAKNSRCQNFVGIEINEQRAEEARQHVSEAISAGFIQPNVSIEILCKNALEVDYSKATAIFLYLVPRGLKLIKPLLVPKQCDHCIRVVTYMSSFKEENYAVKELCQVDHHGETSWPVYLHIFKGENIGA